VTSSEISVLSRKRVKADSESTVQSTLDGYYKKVEYDIDTLLVHAFAVHSLPLHILQSEVFINLMICWRNSEVMLPTSKRMRVMYHDEANRMKQEVLNNMKASKAIPVTVALDGWTNPCHEKVINIIPLSRGIAYYWKSIVLSTQKCSAENQYPQVRDSIQSLISNSVVVVALTTDNEAVNGALYRLLLKDFPFLVHIPCAAHTIQLCVKLIIDLPLINTTIRGMAAIFSAFEKSKEYRLKLINIQKAGSPGKDALNLQKPNDTRWSSVLKAAKRLVLLKDYVQFVLPQESAFWAGLDILVPFLTPFQIATDIVQSDSATLYDVYHQFAGLATQLDAISAQHPLFSIKAEALNAIKSHWRKNINKEAVIASAILSFDESHTELFSRKEIDDSIRWFIHKFSVPFLAYYGCTEVDAAGIEGTLMEQWSEFEGSTGVFLNVVQDKDILKRKQIEKHRTMNADGVQHSRWDARHLWRTKLRSASELSICAMALLSITASEAAVERSFSMQDIVHSKRRNRLKDESVEDEMFIKFNYRALKQQPDSSGTVFELNDENHCVYVTSIFNSDVTADDPSQPLDSAVAVLMHSDEAPHQEAKIDDNEAKTDGSSEALNSERAAVDPTTAFIIQYIQDHHITPLWKWNADKTNHLEITAIERGIGDTSGELKKRIMAHVNKGVAID
jgi:hypothetical protein